MPFPPWGTIRASAASFSPGAGGRSRPAAHVPPWGDGNMGLSPDGGATFFLARAVGIHRAMELTLTGRTLTAEEAAAWGLVQRGFPDDAFEAGGGGLGAAQSVA